MKELIERWEKLANKDEERARKQTNPYTQERLYASADAMRLCADELKRYSPSVGQGD